MKSYPFDLQQKVALITGGSRGLGKAMALALATAGAHVAVASRHLPTCEATAEELRSQTGRDALAIACDVTKPDQIHRMVNTVLEQWGQLDILINNAGINIRQPMETFSLETWQQIMDTNITGPFLCCQAVAPHMKARRSGRIIMIGSIMGEVGLPHRVPYCASKGAIHLMTKALAIEWAPYNITVNAIAPGPFMTDLNAQARQDSEYFRFLADRVPLGQRFGDPEEIGGLAVFLASDAARFITGAIIPVDGGWLAQ